MRKFKINQISCPEFKSTRFVEKKLRGFVAVEKTDKTTAYIYNLFVVKKYRWKGLGSTLLRYCENFAREQGATTITLEIRCNSLNLFYIKNGYCITYGNIATKKL